MGSLINDYLDLSSSDNDSDNQTDHDESGE